LTLGNVRIGLCTDLGIVTKSVYEALRPCEVVVLESNHDPRMLAASDRPEANKIRIAGKKGHLSNRASAEFAVRLAKAGNLKQLYLAHLSAECNRESIARQTVSSAFRKNGIAGVKICMTHQGKKAAVWMPGIFVKKPGFQNFRNCPAGEKQSVNFRTRQTSQSANQPRRRYGAGRSPRQGLTGMKRNSRERNAP